MTQDILSQLDALIDREGCHSVFVGKSALKGRKRFATLRAGAGETVATGAGDTVAEALGDALRSLTRPTMPTVTRPTMPGFTRTMP